MRDEQTNLPAGQALPQSSEQLHQTLHGTRPPAALPVQAEVDRLAYLSDLDEKFATFPSLPSAQAIARRVTKVLGGIHSFQPSSRAGIRERLGSFWLGAVRLLATLQSRGS